MNIIPPVLVTSIQDLLEDPSEKTNWILSRGVMDYKPSTLRVSQTDMLESPSFSLIYPDFDVWGYNLRYMERLSLSFCKLNYMQFTGETNLPENVIQIQNNIINNHLLIDFSSWDIDGFTISRTVLNSSNEVIGKYVFQRMDGGGWRMVFPLSDDPVATSRSSSGIPLRAKLKPMPPLYARRSALIEDLWLSEIV